jgi:tRNA (cmo5U34)-methyltransferase
VFNTFAQDYDSQREYIIPQMHEYSRAAVWAMESDAPEPSIIDIGADTGLLSAFLLEKYPGARLTLVDISGNMPDQAWKRFAARPETAYVVSDYSESDLGGQYDLVCSALSIHHLSAEEKRRLFVRIFEALKPGCLLVNADQAEGGAAVPQLLERVPPEWTNGGGTACGDPETSRYP